MSDKIDKKVIEDITILAKLNLSEDEIEETKNEMVKMIDYADKLKELNTQNVEPMYQVLAGNNVFRDDIVTGKDDRESILANAPQKEKDTFVVPKTFN